MTTTETTATHTCPPSAVVDMIVPWPDVQPGDLVLWDGELRPVERNDTYPGDTGVRLITLAGALAETIPCGTHAAVRRYTDGRTDDEALILAALDEAAGDRDERARASCPDCTYTGDGMCTGQREHAGRASEYRELRDRLEAGR